MYTNQTRQVPVVSSQRNRYIMMLCETDGNLILVEPMKNRTSGEMYKAYEKLMQKMSQSVIKIKKNSHDNEASDGIEDKKVPPNIHHRNEAEKTINTFEDHIKAILTGVNKTFPMHL